jgi:hypothetical protein
LLPSGVPDTLNASVNCSTLFLPDAELCHTGIPHWTVPDRPFLKKTRWQETDAL